MKKAFESEEDFCAIEPEVTSEITACIQTAAQETEQVLKKQFSRLDKARKHKFLIIFSQGRRFARLHKSDSLCPWPYTVVKDCEELDDPKPSQYNARCKICFPTVDSDTSNSEEKLRLINRFTLATRGTVLRLELIHQNRYKPSHPALLLADSLMQTSNYSCFV
jgi:hypothetical protein